MAIAILKWQDFNSSSSQFRIDIGSNRFYAYAIAGDRIKDVNGLKLLDNPKFISEIIGPLPESSLGRTIIEIPHHLFDRQHRHIQLMSFRTPQRVGPALSEIIQIPLSRNFSRELPMALASEITMETQPLPTVAFSYQETPPLSSAMMKVNLGAITGAIGKIFTSPTAKKAIATVGKAATSPTAKQALGKFGAVATNPAVQGALMNLAQQTLAKNGKTGSGLDPATQQLLTMLLQQAATVAPQTETTTSKAKSMSLSLSKSDSYTEQMAIPAALLTQLPALMPLLEKVVTPETIQSLIQNFSPTKTIGKTIGTIANGLMDLKKLNAQIRQNDQQHIEKILATNDKLEEWVVREEPFANTFSANSVALDYQRVERVRLDFAEVKTVMLQGRSQVIYHQNQDLSFPLRLKTRKPIAKGMLQLLVKDPETLEILIEEKFKVTNADSGELDVIPTLSQEQLEFLKPSTHYLVSAVLMWKGRSKSGRVNKRLGTSMTQLIYLMGDYTFDRLEGQGDTIPLKDVNEFRSYWHKIWQGDLSKERRKLRLDCKYYYALEPERYNLARMETSTKIEQVSRTRQEGKLKTGTILNLASLNQLLSQISPRPQLNPEQMDALHCLEFIEKFHHAARTQVEFDGDKGDAVALWIYPEMKLQNIVLKKVQDTDNNGQVTAIYEETIAFPMPGIVHFIGTQA